jgi:hypothetical protein
MVGRKVTQAEIEQNPELKYMLSAAPDSTHTIQTEIYHESGEHFSQSVHEGAGKHFLRHLYLPLFMIAGVAGVGKLYGLTYAYAEPYEDYLNWIVL